MRSRAARLRNVKCRAPDDAIASMASNLEKVREIVSIVRPRWSAISCRDIGNSISFVVWRAVSHFQEKVSNALAGCLDQQCDMGLSAPEFVTHHVSETARDVLIVLSQDRQHTALDDKNF